MAALKKKLFGEGELQTAKYKKEGVLSPKFTHPANASFESSYTFSKESSPFYRENSPNVNNNNGSEGDQATPRLMDQQNVVTDPAAQPAPATAAAAAATKTKQNREGLYDPPWEKSSASKYKVIGRKRTGSAGSSSKPTAKERTPPPVSPKSKKGVQFGEVSTSETPTPGSTELRNVNSLERSKHKKERSPPHHSYSLDRLGRKEPSPPLTLPLTLISPHKMISPSSSAIEDGNSLLASITDTLQKQSKYGSDTLLSPPTSGLMSPISGMENPKTKKVQSEVRMSSRGELEKIRAAHRREPPPPPAGTVAQPTRTSPQGPLMAHAATRTSPQNHQGSTVMAQHTRTSPEGPPMVQAATHTSPQNHQGATMAQPTRTSPQNHQSPSHTALASPKQTASHHSSQILPGPAQQSGQVKRKMFSGRPRMAASLDELQTDPSIQVTYDAKSKSHIFRSLV